MTLPTVDHRRFLVAAASKMESGVDGERFGRFRVGDTRPISFGSGECCNSVRPNITDTVDK